MRCLCICVALLAALAAEPVLVEKPADLPTLVNPNCSHCKDEAKRRQGELKDSDRVLCWVRGKYEGGAIPFRFFLNRYPVISDTYGVFVYDHDAGFARGFAPSLDFTFHGWRNGVLALKHKDGTLYSALSGRAFAGPKKGTRLKPVPTIQSDWGWWLKHYPDTVAYHLYPKYKPVEAPSRPNAAALKSRGKPDPRLPADERVLGVSDGKNTRAYRIADLKKTPLLKDELGGRALYVLYYDKTRSAAAYSASSLALAPRIGGEKRAQIQGPSLSLELDSKSTDAPFRSSAGSFDIAGRCITGKGKELGATLPWVDGVEVKWFAWAAEYPDTTIYKPTKR